MKWIPIHLTIKRENWPDLTKVRLCTIPAPFRFGTGLERVLIVTQSKRSRIAIRFKLVLPVLPEEYYQKSPNLQSDFVYISNKCCGKSPNMAILATLEYEVMGSHGEITEQIAYNHDNLGPDEQFLLPFSTSLSGRALP